MKIAIIGTGGVGGYFGGKIASAGNDVTFLARGEHLKALQSNGMTVKSINGNFQIQPIRATDKIKHIGKSDLIILGVKAWQVKEIALELPEIIHEKSVVLPLQNGVLAVDELEEKLDRKNIIGGLCRIMSKIESPGVINHFGMEPTIIFGELDNRQTDRMNDIKNLFDQSGIKSRIANDIHAELWKKFIPICAGGLLAVTRSTYGEIREHEPTRNLLIDLLNEIYVLSQRIGIKIEKDFVSKTVAFIDTFPHDSTASMTRNIWEGKPSEIEYQNGTVVKLGERYGIETPINKFIYTCISLLERRARK